MNKKIIKKISLWLCAISALGPSLLVVYFTNTGIGLIMYFLLIGIISMEFNLVEIQDELKKSNKINYLLLKKLVNKRK